jgi:hypothetical protein
MKPHIEQTIADLRGQMALCQQAIDLITRIDALGNNLAACLAPAVAGPGLAGIEDVSPLAGSRLIGPATAKSEARNPKPRRKSEIRSPEIQSASPVAAPSGFGPRGLGFRSEATSGVRDHRSAAYLEAARQLGQEFSGQAFADATGKDLKTVRLVLYRWENKCWIERAGRGSFRKTLTFPQTDRPDATPAAAPPTKPAAAVVPMPDESAKNPDPKVVLRKALEDALKVRDDHRGAGREKMAKIYQRKADKLQALLGE